jgi:hypothetical protein
MEIRSGVKLILQSATYDGKLFINDGVQLGSTIPDKGSLKYDYDAFIPKHTWRNPSLEERQTILAYESERIDYSKSILINRLPNSIIEKMELLDLSKCSDYPSVLNTFKRHSAVVNDFQDELIEILIGYSESFENMNFHRIVFNPPSIETLTYFIDGSNLVFVGFHIDRSTVFDFSNVEKSKNRICINVGSEDRIVYFINLTINQMREMLLEYGQVKDEELTPDNVGSFFFKSFPDYPVVKVIQAPYEYYIMPTDNVLHDGSSLGKARHDICLVYLGHLNTYVRED